MARDKHLLLLRFSALGDILMTVPVIDALAKKYPDTTFTVVSRVYVGSIFRRCPANVHFRGVKLEQYGGVAGLSRLVGELCHELKPTQVCDLHDVLRTKIMRQLFRLRGIPTCHIVKNRKARKRFITSRPLLQQETSFERYAKALGRAGFPVCLPDNNAETDEEHRTVGSGCEVRRVGIAPFAAHETKIYPLEKMEQVVRLLSEQGIKVYLFGAGREEKNVMEQWASRYERVESVAGTLPDMAAEADLIGTLDCMLTMDSGNMHLAALTPVRLLSIWGATHPKGGFLPWRRDESGCIQRELECRPCSIYGNKACRFGDCRCLDISPTEIVKRICE